MPRDLVDLAKKVLEVLMRNSSFLALNIGLYQTTGVITPYTYRDV
jgi:hypothetical protein